MCAPSRPSPDAYDTNPQIAPHFAATPALTRLAFGHAYSIEAAEIRRECSALYRQHNLTRRQHYGLYHAGTREELEDVHRERTVIMVIELGALDIRRGKWRELDTEAREILRWWRLSGRLGVCLRFYRARVPEVGSSSTVQDHALDERETFYEAYPEFPALSRSLAPVHPPLAVPPRVQHDYDSDAEFGIGQTWLIPTTVYSSDSETETDIHELPELEPARVPIMPAPVAPWDLPPLHPSTSPPRRSSPRRPQLIPDTSSDTDNYDEPPTPQPEPELLPEPAIHVLPDSSTPIPPWDVVPTTAPVTPRRPRPQPSVPAHVISLDSPWVAPWGRYSSEAAGSAARSAFSPAVAAGAARRGSGDFVPPAGEVPWLPGLTSVTGRMPRGHRGRVNSATVDGEANAERHAEAVRGRNRWDAEGGPEVTGGTAASGSVPAGAAAAPAPARARRAARAPRNIREAFERLTVALGEQEVREQDSGVWARSRKPGLPAAAVQRV
ncbi:hypothetical protein B0A55_03099 [Friedmanniomyces simplex]|uniref:Uncharacterized protein n=1 Tax=Friedmanniomyces simplex TaxID=329884 RepID=A0A4U0XPU4_9PEZI|nr:hypothetical protein B0A55_03099 [Friedmanniomyces simplex]